MNYQFYTYEIPSTVTFFEGKVQQDICFLYGLSTVTSGNTYLIKFPVGTYNNYKFQSFINLTKNGKSVNLFSQYYPEKNAYKESCTVYYYISGLNGYNTTSNTQESNTKSWTYFFNKPQKKEFYNIQSTNIKIKDLLNNGVIFPQNGISSFCYNECNIFSTNQSIPCSVNITLPSGTSGQKAFNAMVDDDIGYIFILDCTTQLNKIIKLPVCKYYNSFSNSAIESGKITKKKDLFNIIAYHGINSTVKEENIFNYVYPESNASKNGKYRVYIIKNSSENTYYNHINQNFVSNINNATWFLSENNVNLQLQKVIKNINQSAVICADYILVIKNIISYGIQFPCSSFICDNINDYIIKYVYNSQTINAQHVTIY